MKNLLITAFILLSFVACQKQSVPLGSRTAAPTPSPTSVASREEPLWEISPDKFRQTWAAFTKDGRFRMAQTHEVAGIPYNYGFSNEVLVIVVDQTATDDSRFKLAFFKAPDYKLFWVDHNFKLANSRLGNFSSVQYIFEGGEPPTRSARLEWDAKRHKYTCLAT